MTLASKITVGRIFMIPVFAALAWSYGQSTRDGAADESLRWWALAVFIIAASSDGVDGWVARRFNQKSDFGAFIDPIADKGLMLTGVLVACLFDWGAVGWRLPFWFVALVFLREAVILGGIAALWSRHRHVTMDPHWSSKLCTVLQMFALGWVMLRVPLFPPALACVPAALLTVWSGIEYFGRGLRILRGVERVH
ncbi:MAG: CDP-alcohol phosphatidyltransferase family protein [Luteolibacter sp.]